MILAIDPGDISSAWVLYDQKNKIPLKFAKDDNDSILDIVSNFTYNKLLIQIARPHGMPISINKLSTYIWIGRFWGAFGRDNVELIDVDDVKRFFFGKIDKIKNSDIYKEVLKRYGGDKKIVCGTKEKPGILYGFNLETTLALSVAISFSEKNS